MGVRRFFLLSFRFRPFHAPLLSLLYLEQFWGVVRPGPPSESIRAEFQVRLMKFNHSQHMKFISPLCGGSASPVWVLQFPSFGCVLHQLLCMCKTCNDFTHHDSTEMSRDREFGFFSGGTMPEWCKARRDTEVKVQALFQRVGFLCMYSMWGWICSGLGYSARFPSLNHGGSLAHLPPSCALALSFTVSSWRRPRGLWGAQLL